MGDNIILVTGHLFAQNLFDLVQLAIIDFDGFEQDMSVVAVVKDICAMD